MPYGQAVIPDDWMGDYCCYSVKWPNSPEWQAILRGVLIIATEGRYWNGATGSIIEAQETIKPTLDHNLKLEECIMSCNEELTQAILDLVTAIGNNQPCPPQVVVGGGSGGSSSASCYANSNSGIQQIITLPDDTNWPLYGDQPIVELPESGFPEGYTDVDQYTQDKCRKAARMADDFIASLRNIGTITWVASALGTATLGGALVGLITLPVAAIPVFLFILIGAIGINAYIIELANEVESNKQDLICLLFNSDSVQAVYDTLQTFLTGLVTIVNPPAGLATALVQIGMHLMNPDVLAALFTSVGMEIYPDATCSCASCEDPTEKSWNFSTNPLTASEPWTFETISGNVQAYQWYDPFDTLLINITDGSSVSRFKSPVGCYIGDTFQVNLSAQANPGPLEVWGVIHYVDDTETEEIFTTTLPSLGTNYSIDINPDLQVVWVAVDWRWAGITGGFNFSGFFNGPDIFFVA